MWRNLAKQAASRKVKFSSESHISSCFSSSTKFSRDSIILEKVRPFSVKSRFAVLGFSPNGPISSQKENLRKPSLLNSGEPFGFSGFSNGYANYAEAIVTTDAEEESSGPDENHQELLDEIERQNKVDSYLKKPKKMVGGLGIAKYNVLRKKQIQIETEAWEEAAKEYQELLMDMCEQKLAPNLPYVKSLFLGWFEPLRDAIANDQKMCNERKNKPAYAPYLDQLPADMMAVITMHKLMGLLMTNSGGVGNVRVVQAACQIGEALEHEVSKLGIFEYVKVSDQNLCSIVCSIRSKQDPSLYVCHSMNYGHSQNNKWL